MSDYATALRAGQMLGIVLLAGIQGGCGGRPLRDQTMQAGTAQARGTVCGVHPSARWLVTPDSVGPIPVAGLTVERVRRLCPDARDSVSWEVNQNLPVLMLPAFTGKVLFLPAVYAPESGAVAGGPVAYIQVKTANIRTPDGLGVGSTFAELRARYGSMLLVFDEGVGAIAVPRGGPIRGIGFLLADFGAITPAGGGWDADTLLFSERVPGTIRVEAVLVWQPRPPPPRD